MCVCVLFEFVCVHRERRTDIKVYGFPVIISACSGKICFIEIMIYCCSFDFIIFARIYIYSLYVLIFAINYFRISSFYLRVFIEKESERARERFVPRPLHCFRTFRLCFVRTLLCFSQKTTECVYWMISNLFFFIFVAGMTECWLQWQLWRLGCYPQIHTA